MKNTIIVFITILVGLFALFSFLDYGGEYSAEKSLWEINKQVVKIAKDPKAVPTASYKKSENQYKAFIKKHPNSTLVPMANVLLGKVYALEKDYPKAMETFEYSIKRYSNTPTVALQALVEIGKIYDANKDFDNLMKNYNRIVGKYPLTPLGLKLPVIIGKAYSSKANMVLSTKAYEKAIEHYKKIAEENPGTAAAFESMRFMSVCYLVLGKKSKALDVLGNLLIESAQTRYLNVHTAPVILKAINSTAVSSLENLNISLLIYRKFISTYPDNPLVPLIKKIMVKLEDIKKTPHNQKEVSSTAK